MEIKLKEYSDDEIEVLLSHVHGLLSEYHCRYPYLTDTQVNCLMCEYYPMCRFYGQVAVELYIEQRRRKKK